MKNNIHKSGQRHNRAKVTDAQILEMFEAYDNGLETVKEIAARHGITVVHLNDILVGKTRTDNAVINQRRKKLAYRSRSKRHNEPQGQRLLTRKQFGEAIFQKIKAEIESRGHSLWPKNFPPDYPVSRRVLYDIKRGHFKIETLNSLPGIEVREWFEIL